MFPSGLRAIEEMFLRFSKANVKDLLLLHKRQENVQREIALIWIKRTLRGQRLILDCQLGCRASCHRE